MTRKRPDDVARIDRGKSTGGRRRRHCRMLVLAGSGTVKCPALASST